MSVHQSACRPPGLYWSYQRQTETTTETHHGEGPSEGQQSRGAGCCWCCYCVSCAKHKANRSIRCVSHVVLRLFWHFPPLFLLSCRSFVEKSQTHRTRECNPCWHFVENENNGSFHQNKPSVSSRSSHRTTNRRAAFDSLCLSVGCIHFIH